MPALPLDVLAEKGVVQENVWRKGGEAEGLKETVFEIATRANDEMMTARLEWKGEDGKMGKIPKEEMPAFLGAVRGRYSSPPHPSCPRMLDAGREGRKPELTFPLVFGLCRFQHKLTWPSYKKSTLTPSIRVFNSVTGAILSTCGWRGGSR
jgi:hypothetical protein